MAATTSRSARTGPFTFPDGLARGTAYTVTIGTQPSNPAQTCAVAHASGTIASANVTDVAVSLRRSDLRRWFRWGPRAGFGTAGATERQCAGPSVEAPGDEQRQRPAWLSTSTGLHMLVRTGSGEGSAPGEPGSALREARISRRLTVGARLFDAQRGGRLIEQPFQASASKKMRSVPRSTQERAL